MLTLKALLTDKTLFICVSGTILEWYDFALFGSFATLFAKLYFPATNHFTSLLATFALFASGFLMRPLGGIAFGHIGDKFGRKAALSYSVLLMAIPTTLIGCLPTYSQMGISAAILLVALRLMQGIAASGEYPGVITFLSENTKPEYRGFYVSLGVVGVIAGILFGSVICTVLSAWLSTQQLMDWGWRIPFLLGLPLGYVGWCLRLQMSETIIFKQLESSQKILKLPVWGIFKTNFSSLITLIFIFIFSNAFFYILFVYLINFSTSYNSISLHDVLSINSLNMLILLFIIPVMGYLADKLGGKSIMLAAATATLVLAYPLFFLITRNSVLSLFVGQLILSCCYAAFIGSGISVVSQIIPDQMRYSGISLGINISAAIFGGTAPMIATYLIHITGNPMSPSFYLMAVAMIGLIASLRLPNKINSAFSNQSLVITN